ncbi:MAG: adenylate/guanylate cyclase domain-containing protein, partial [Burkholderiales bacterium]|nr:adenylate/guanylate cyclase domain-containing protein [Burkholderiales bacterium]
KAVEIGLEGVALAARLSDPRAELLSHGLVAAMAARMLCDVELAAVHAAEQRRLAEMLGANRFYAQALHNAAEIALAKGDREGARKLCRQALMDVGEAGRRFVGPILYGDLARAARDAGERAQALREGEALLDAGAVSHNHFWFVSTAIEAAFEQEDWDGIERYCARLERYSAPEPLPWSDFVIARGRALARFGRGERSEALRAILSELRGAAARAEFNAALPTLDLALATLGSGAGG